jgi:uncharacterized protein (DUF433 family)/DNA-binding transcriptional MerR regulator
MVEAFSQDLVTRITGLSRRQLEYWDQTDVIKPSVAESEGRGSPRLYSFRDLIELKVAAGMRRKLRPAQMRELIKQLEARGFDDPFVTVTFVETSDGRQIAYIDPKHGALSAHGREVGTVVETFGLRPKNLRTGLEKKVATVMARRPGRIAKVRGLHGGQPVIQGTRVPVSKIVALTDAGWDDSRILSAFPHLSPADVKAAQDYARKTETRSA